MRCLPRRTCKAFRRCSAASGSCATKRGRPSFALKAAPWLKCCRGSRSAPTTGTPRAADSSRTSWRRNRSAGTSKSFGLLVLSLLRAGKIQATSKGQTIDSATGIEARDTFSNNNFFRQASFRPKKGIEFEELVKASEAFRDTFGSEVRELNAGAIVVRASQGNRAA